MHKDLAQNEHLACVGSADEMGGWNPEGARQMTLGDESVWTTTLQLEESQDIQYKYIVLTKPQYEPKIDGNRRLDIATDAPNLFTVIDTFSKTNRGLTRGYFQHALSPEGLGECRFELVVHDSTDISQIYVVGAHPTLGSWREEDGVALEPAKPGSNVWVGTAHLPVGENLDYKLVVFRAGSVAPQPVRNLTLPAGGGKLHVRDSTDSSSAQADTRAISHTTSASSCLCQFEVRVPNAKEGTTVSLLGSHEFLGEWELARAVPMFSTGDNIYSASMHLPVGTQLQYKYMIKSGAVWDHTERRINLAAPITVTRSTLWGLPDSMRRAPPLVVHSMSTGDVSLASNESKLCTFRLEGVELDTQEGFWLGVTGDCSALGDWNISRCMRMQSHTENGRVIFTATAKLAAACPVNYNYVILREPLWEMRGQNRIYTVPPSNCEWPELRRDNMRLVRRVRDLVGPSAIQDHHTAKAAFAKQTFAPASEPVDDYAYLEPVDESLCGTSLVKFDVEVAGLSENDFVWVCGDAPGLGAWELSQSQRMRRCDVVPGQHASSHIWSAIARVPSGCQLTYKYCVAQAGAQMAQACWELGPHRMFSVPSHGRGAIFDRFQSPLDLAPSVQTPVKPALAADAAASTHPMPDVTVPEESSGSDPNAADSPLLTSPLTLSTASTQPLATRDGSPAPLTRYRSPTPLPIAAMGQPARTVLADFSVDVHGVSGDDEVYLCGSDRELGGWSLDKAVKLEQVDEKHAPCGLWRCRVSVTAGTEVKYKYVVRRGGQWMWEPGGDRTLATREQHRITVVGDELADYSGNVCKGHADTVDDRLLSNKSIALLPLERGLEEVLTQTDDFLREVRAKPIGSLSHGRAFNELIKRNRIHLQRCHSILDKMSDAHTREQVEKRIKRLERVYDAFATVSNNPVRLPAFTPAMTPTPEITSAPDPGVTSAPVLSRASFPDLREAQQKLSHAESEPARSVAEYPEEIQVGFSVKAHGVSGDDEVYLCGSDRELGGWSLDKAVKLEQVDEKHAPCGLWRCRVSVTAGTEVKYKYVVRRGGQWMWEPGGDRTLAAHDVTVGSWIEEELAAHGGHVCKVSVDEFDKNDEKVPAQGHGVGGGVNAAHEELLGETDSFLRDIRMQPTGGLSNSHSLNEYVNRNRLYLQRCHSMLDKTSDAHRRGQVEKRIKKLERVYDALVTVSHKSERLPQLMSSPPPVEAAEADSMHGQGGSFSRVTLSPVSERNSSPLPDGAKSPRQGPSRHASNLEVAVARGTRAPSPVSPTREPSEAAPPCAGVSYHAEPRRGIGMVQQVLPESPAHRAGLLEGDVILAMGGTNIHSVAKGGGLFAAIADEVGEKAAAGAFMDVTVLRRSQKMGQQVATFKLRPARWAGDGLLGMRLRNLGRPTA